MKETVPGRAETEETGSRLPNVRGMGRARFNNGQAMRRKVAGFVDDRVHPELALGRVDGGLECGPHAMAGGNIGRGEGKNPEMGTAAAPRAASRTAKGRQQWEQAVQGASEEICDVEAAGYACDREGLENGGGLGREANV